MSTHLSNTRALVTGAAGFIGSHLCDALLTAGAEVVGVDNFITGRQSNVEHLRNHPQFNLIKADASTKTDSYWPSDFAPDLVFHFASPASPPRYQAAPIETYLVNSHATHLLLSHLTTHCPQARFIFASTSEVYGDPHEHPQPESYWGNVNPNGPRSCYDEAKRLGETICGIHHRDFGIDTRIVRIFNTYGPRINPLDGRVIPNLISQALAGQPLTIYGDGLQTRSYCYVDDLVRGIILLATTPTAAGETVNLGNPEEQTILETATAIQAALGVNLEHLNQPLPQDDPVRRRPDISKAKTLLGWQPTVSFSDGLARTIDYFKKEQK